MTKAPPRPGGAGTDAVSTASGQITKLAGLVIPARSGAVVYRAVPAHLACRVGARPRAGERNAWLAVVSIALGSFVLGFSEVIPVGLLGDVSGHQGVSIGTGGLIIVLVAVWGAGFGMGRSGAAIGSPPANPAGLAREPGTSRQRAR